MLRPTRLARLVHAANWKYALGELVLIVTGILLALGIDNWNDGRLERQRQVRSLREVRSALQSDVRDIRSNLEFQAAAQAKSGILLRHMAQGLPYADSLDEHFSSVLHHTELIENSSAYETLKTRGLDLITDDSLRFALSEIYDVMYEQVESAEANQKALFRTDLMPYYMRHFSGISIERSTPRDYSRLLSDPYYEGMVTYMMGQRSALLANYERLTARVTAVVGALDREIARLD